MVEVYFKMLKGSLHCSQWLGCSRAAYTVVSDGIWPIHTLMYVLITYKDEKIKWKLKALEWLQNYTAIF